MSLELPASGSQRQKTSSTFVGRYWAVLSYFLFFQALLGKTAYPNECFWKSFKPPTHLDFWDGDFVSKPWALLS